MWGFRFAPAHNQTGVVRLEIFQCADLCRQQGTALLDPEEQASRCCALPTASRVWSGDNWNLVHMGAPRRYDREGKDNDWAHPDEPKEEGCPGAWYRTPFLASLLRYHRTRDDHGGRVSNPALEQCTDHLVHEAIRELELHEDNAFGKYLDYVRKQRPQT